MNLQKICMKIYETQLGAEKKTKSFSKISL